MKNYLSFGGGVNSVALYLWLVENKWDFEAVFVDHGTDWPETYEYVEMFKSKYPVTTIKPSRNIITPYKATFNSLYDFCWAKKMFPSRVTRWCTADFKRNPLNSYQPKECFVLIGFDYSEERRAVIYSDGGREFRYPLIEAEIDRSKCKEIIKSHGLPVPPKSGCFVCPFQRVGQLRELRKKHPDLFCKLERLEDRNNVERENRGLKPYYSFKKPVRAVAEKNINQKPIFIEDEFPPCECML